MLEKYNDESKIDVLVLPELSFQGGYFYSKEEVLWYSEKAPLQISKETKDATVSD